MLVSTAITEYLYALVNTSPATKRTKKHILLEFNRWCNEQQLQLEHLKPTELRRYTEYLRNRKTPRGRPLSNTSLNCYLVHIKAFLKWCSHEEEFEGLITEKSIKRVELPKPDIKVIEIFTADQFQQLYKACDNCRYETQKYRNRAILYLLIDTGLRASELCTLTLDCVFFGANESYIRVTGKGRKQREVGFGAKTRKALRTYLYRYRKAEKDNKYVFISRSDEHLSPSGLNEILYELRNSTDISGVRVSAHTFRHTFAVNYLKQGGDIYKLSRLLGHSSLEMTERYLRAYQEREARQGGISVLDNFT